MLNNEEHLKLLDELVRLENIIEKQKEHLEDLSKKLSSEKQIRSKLELKYNKPSHFVLEGLPIKFEQQKTIIRNMKHLNCTTYLDGQANKIYKDEIWKELKYQINNVLDDSVKDIIHTYKHKATYQTIYSTNLWFVIPEKEN